MQKVIFDMDGVIIDSEPIYSIVYDKIFKMLNVNISKEERSSFVGLSAKKVWLYVKEKGRLSETVDELLEIKEKVYFETFTSCREYHKPISGVVQLLEALKRNGISLSIASSANRDMVNFVIDKLGLRSYFDYIISGEEVIHGKPEPDIFLKVAENYDELPNRFTVIEDSENGVKAAKLAGMKCIGYKNINSGNQDLSSADLIIEEFNKISIDKILELIVQV